MVRLDKDEASNRMQASIIQPSQTPPPKLISLSELGISKIFTTYITRGNSVILKLVFNFPSESVRIPTTNNYAAVAITLSRKLAVWKSIDEEGTELERVHYNSDIIYYKRKFYAVDFYGKTITVDVFSKAVSVVVSWLPDNAKSSEETYLVECCGDLLLISMLIKNVEVYKLNEEKHAWDRVANLGDQMLIVGYDGCFSVSAPDFAGSKRNAIYFTDYSLLFDLDKGKLIEI